MRRRTFLKLAAGTAAAGALGAYPLISAIRCRVNGFPVALPGLSPEFEGFRIAFLCDLHLGPLVPLGYLESVIRLANAQKPDLILLGGDYVFASPTYIPAITRVLGKLRAPEGVFAVLGNHDHIQGAAATSRGLCENGIREITNTGGWIQRGDGRFRVTGVDDLVTGRPDWVGALQDIDPEIPNVLVTHNPDLLEYMKLPVSFALCGHTHGGQVCLPGIGPPLIPSHFGQKYAYGPVQAPTTRAYVSSGVGTSYIPVRINCPAEIAMLTLKAAVES